MRAYPEGMLLLAEMLIVFFGRLNLPPFVGVRLKKDSLSAHFIQETVILRKDESQSGEKIRKKICSLQRGSRDV